MQQYNCQECGAPLAWNPEKGALVCPFCDKSYTPEQFGNPEQLENKQDDTKQDQDTAKSVSQEEAASLDSQGMVVYECDICGGEVTTDKTTTATTCPYCGSNISITSKSADFHPDLVIPFEITKDEAIKRYKQHVSKAILAPKIFKSDTFLEKIQGTYAPFLLHDMAYNGRYVVKFKKTTSTRIGDDKVEKTDYYEASGLLDTDIRKLPTDASTKMPDNMMLALEPYEYGDKLKDYVPAYMAGYLANTKDVAEDKLKEAAQSRGREGIKTLLKGRYDSKGIVYDVDTCNVGVKSHTSKYAMLPLYMFTVRREGERYPFAVNGQTGKVVGKIPVAYMKMAMIAAGFFLAGNLATFLYFILV